MIGRRLGFGEARYTALEDEPLLHPGRAARVVAERDGERAGVGVVLAGVVGELHPSVAESVDLRGARLIVAELDIAGLGGGRFADIRAAALSRHPAAERDLAIVVAGSVPAVTVADAIRSAAGPELVSVHLFDIYRGAPLEATDKSLAWRLVLQADDRTLTDAEIDATLAAITSALRAVGGRIRT